MDAALWRFTNIADRLESRMLKVEGGDFDIAEARLALSDARTSLGVASDLLAGIDAAVVKGVTTNEPIHAMAELRAMYETIATALRKAHSSLRISVALLKAASETATETDTATTTPTSVTDQAQ